MSTALSAQHTLIGFLKKPSSYPHQPEAIEIVQTHASILAIAPPYVYKFKKQFDFGFMDFRTLEARRENCRRELELNRRLCREVYLEVLPLYSEEGQLTFRTGKHVVDYALKMKQMPDGYFMHQLLQKGELSTLQLEQVLQRLKNFYEQQTADPSIIPYGDISHLRRNTDENFNSLRDMDKSIINPLALEVIERQTNQFYRQSAALFEKRMAEGRIRDCHGDLHLDHIHLQEGRICIFDCIEFSDRFRYIDIAADIAFLAMDLDFAGRPDLAAFVTERMAELLQDQDMLKLMDYYKCYRACVRAKVEGLRVLQAEVPKAEKKKGSDKVKRYLQLALQYSLTGSKPAVIIICGSIGSGKSTMARQLSALLAFSKLSSDELRKQMAGIPLHQRSNAGQRSLLYSGQKKDEVYHQLLHHTLEQLHNHHATVVDASFGKKKHRQAFIQALEKEQSFYCFVECRASEKTVKTRLKKREARPSVSDARLEDYLSLSKAFEPHTEIPPEHYIEINTERTPTESIRELLNALAGLVHGTGSKQES